VLASLVAGLATTPYAAYHFHRTAPYGVLANLLAMPIVSAWVMPSGLLALVALPFGFDAPLWRLMGLGIDWMTGIALWVASLPGAVGRVAAFGAGPLLLGTAGLVLICLLRSPLRWSGGLLIVIAVVAAARTPLPDVLVAASGNAVAVRTASGQLAIVKAGNDQFVAREWLAADGDARSPTDKALADGFSCDDGGCVARLADGTPVSFAQTPEAIAEDCAVAAIVVTRRELPPRCAAKGLDRTVLRQHGAMALRKIATGWEVEAAHPVGYDRPWARAAAKPGIATAASTPQAHSGPRDAQPKPEDLEPGD
jgi:competence protein ComEC